MSPSSVSHALLLWGLVLFLLGLCSGLAMLYLAGAFKNLRLALASHLVGVSSGMFLIVAGLLVSRLTLPDNLWPVTFGLLIYGNYGNWLATLLAGVFGTKSLTPLASAGNETIAPPWQEALVKFGLMSSGTATIAAVAIMIWGLCGQ